jgi:hypothetical protein
MKHVSTAVIPFLSRRQLIAPLALWLATSGAAQAQAPTFAAPATYGVGATKPAKLAAGDLNGDGRPDLVLSSYASPGVVSVLLALPAPALPGTYPATATPYSTGGAQPSGVALGDVNGDGRLDLVAANCGSSTLAVLLGSAAAPGTFGPAATYPTGVPGSTPREVALGDFNGDGRLDIAAANQSNNTVSVLLGLGAAPGTFGPAAAYPTGGTAPEGLKTGDLNGDGRPDLVVTNSISGTVAVLLGAPATPGTFGPAVTYSAGGLDTWSVALHDVNKDGRLDLIATNNGNNTIGVLLGAPAAPGTFGLAATYAAPTPGYLALGDVNGDGRLDVVTNSYLYGTTTSVLLGQATAGTFGAATTFATGGNGPVGLVVADLNNDGRPDLATANFVSSTVSVLLNAGTFTPLATGSALVPAALDLYPNPAHEAFTVQLPAGFSATQPELLNALGQVVRRPEASGSSFRVETSGLAPGVYTLRLHSGEALLTKRVVVE